MHVYGLHNPSVNSCFTTIIALCTQAQPNPKELPQGPGARHPCSWERGGHKAPDRGERQPLLSESLPRGHIDLQKQLKGGRLIRKRRCCMQRAVSRNSAPSRLLPAQGTRLHSQVSAQHCHPRPTPHQDTSPLPASVLAFADGKLPALVFQRHEQSKEAQTTEQESRQRRQQPFLHSPQHTTDTRCRFDAFALSNIAPGGDPQPSMQTSPRSTSTELARPCTGQHAQPHHGPKKQQPSSSMMKRARDNQAASPQLPPC